MQVSTQVARPPFVSFEYRSVERRTQEGMVELRDVAYAIITPAGSKDRVEKIAEEWLEHIQHEAMVSEGERFPLVWVQHYKAAYQAWKSGQELPVDGTPVRSWPVASPSQVKHLLSLHVITVEQLAEANEETIHRLGMGGRALVQQAKDFLASKDGSGKLVSQLSAYRVRTETLEEQNKELRAQLAALSSQVQLMSKAFPGASSAVGDSGTISASDLLDSEG